MNVIIKIHFNFKYIRNENKKKYLPNHLIYAGEITKKRKTSTQNKPKDARQFTNIEFWRYRSFGLFLTELETVAKTPFLAETRRNRNRIFGRTLLKI